MKQVTKIVQQAGNGGHIYLPKEMIGQKVAVTLIKKSISDIEEEILSILKPHLEHIKGIYLHGSYARNEQTPDSDIDVLVITDRKIKKKINEYEIISSTEKQIGDTIKNNAVLILPILKEAMPILNKGLIGGYKEERLTKKNTRWYIETTESSLKLAKILIDTKDGIPNIVYPLILRLRGLYLIESLIGNKKYSNKGIMNFLIKNGIDKAEQIYSMYREYRDNKAISDNSLDYGDMLRLYNLVNGYFLKVRLLWEKLS